MQAAEFEAHGGDCGRLARLKLTIEPHQTLWYGNGMQPEPFGDLEHRTYFFDQGIRFACRQCGGCCVGDPGTIYVFESEIETIADFLNLNREAFEDEYLYPFKDSYSIREHADGRCLFFNDGCTIYPIRPLQCRTYPFWFSNMRSERRWRRVAGQCPGIGGGRRYARPEILEMIRQSIPF